MLQIHFYGASIYIKKRGRHDGGGGGGGNMQGGGVLDGFGSNISKNPITVYHTLGAEAEGI